MLIEFWYLFPVGVIIAILAMSSGISGSNFWIPVYMIWLNIEPKVGFWLALLTMIFGFGSGVWKNLKAKTINWHLTKIYLKITIPASLIGALLSSYAPIKILLLIFAGFVISYGSFLLYQFFKSDSTQEVPHNNIYWKTATIAGFLKGLVATGLGKLILPCMVNHQSIKHHSEAVGSTVMIVFIINIVSLIGRMNASLVDSLILNQTYIMMIMIWVAPSVVIGGQIGPVIAQKIPKIYMRAYVGALLIFVGILIFIRAFSVINGH